MLKTNDNFFESLAVIYHVTVWLILPIISLWLPFYILFFTPFWWTMCFYFIWYCYDFNTPSKGSRKWNWHRNWVLWKHFANYFPITLVKTCDLPPNNNYILGCHPHGILSIGSFTHLCTNATRFNDLFPNLESNIVTLGGQFWFPFRREIGIAMGGIASNKNSIKYLLEKPEKNHLIGIVLGGAEEALDAKPGNYDLNILSRRGFCELALKYGAHLVPSYSFGENNVFFQSNNERGSSLRKVQSLIKKKAGFCPPFFFGRGIIHKNFGILPLKCPITTVIGAPIQVPCFKKPTQLQIEALHARYCVALNELFESHKHKYNIKPNVHLNFY